MATGTSTAPRKSADVEDEIFQQAERAEEEASEDEIFQAAEEAEAEDTTPVAGVGVSEAMPAPGESWYVPFSAEQAAQVNPAWDGKTMGSGPPPLPTPPPPPSSDADEGFISRYLKDKVETGRARVAGALNYTTSSFPDELFGLVRMPVELRRRIEYNQAIPKNSRELNMMYRGLRDSYRVSEDKLRDDRPGDFHAAGVAASLLLPTPKVPGPVGPAVTGGLQGLLSGVGGSSAEMLDPTAADLVQLKSDADWGTGVGAAFGVAGQAAGNFAEWAGAKYGPAVQKYLARKAEEKALKSATGRNLPLWQRLLSEDPESVNEIGRDMLDQGLLDKSAPSPGGKPLGFWDKWIPGMPVEEVRRRASAVAEREGKNIDTALREVDALIPEDQRWWKYDISREIEDYLVKPRKAMTAGDEAVANRLRAEADKMRHYTRESRPSLMDIETYKRGLDDFIDHEAQKMAPMAKGLDDLRDRLANNVEQRAWQAASAAGSDAAERFVESKRLFGNMATIADPASKQAARELTNRMFSASDYGAGAAAAISGSENSNPVATGIRGLAAAAFNKFARERGNQVMASGMNAASQSDWLEHVIQVQPGALGPYAQPLSDALARGGRSALAIQDFLLGNTDEEYANLRRRLPGLASGEYPAQ